MRGPIVMLWDRHPIHKRRKVTAFLAQHSRLRAYWFPTCAPELNPVEYVWTQVSEFTANTAPRDANELKNNVKGALARTRRSEKRLWACIYGSALPWRH